MITVTVIRQAFESLVSIQNAVFPKARNHMRVFVCTIDQTELKSIPQCTYHVVLDQGAVGRLNVEDVNTLLIGSLGFTRTQNLNGIILISTDIVTPNLNDLHKIGTQLQHLLGGGTYNNVQTLP